VLIYLEVKMLKLCPRCGIERDEKDYSFSRFKIKSGWCKFCVKNYNDNYKLINADYEKNRYQQNKRSSYHKKYRDSHKEEIKSYNQQYYQENKVELNSAHNEYIKDLRNNDTLFKLKDNISKCINRALRRNFSSKNGESSSEYLPYSIQELKQHLEKQFDPWMTWNNWGTYNKDSWKDSDPTTWTWNIDHIIPRSFLPYASMEDDNFKKCWALENLRPLSSKRNVIENNKRSTNF